MAVKPLNDRILVKRVEEEQRSAGGIIIPDTAKEKPMQARVIAVGPGRWEKDKRIPVDIKEGDLILIGKYTGTEIKINGEDHLIVREDEILANIIE